MKNRLLPALALCVLGSLASPAIAADAPQQLPPFRIAGYLPDYRFPQFQAELADGLTDLILFSAELSENGSLNLTRLKDCPWPKLLAFKTQKHVRLILSIGGWERSQHFASVAGSAQKRGRCVASILQLCLDKRLDGIDLDWEHPKGAAEEESYGKLLRELRTAFEPHKLMLSVTLAAWQRISPEAIAAVDSVQVMAYDHADRHSTFEQAEKDVKAMITAGLPSRKIVLGVPFYGRDVKTRAAMTYGEIVTKHAPAPDVDQVGPMYFNGPETIRRKTKLALNSKLGGVMIWELGQDAPAAQSLLKVIRETVDAQRSK